MDDQTTATKDSYIIVRLRQKHREEIERAAELEEDTLSGFVREVVLSAARRRIKKERHAA